MSKFHLTFSTLRTANACRLPQFKNAKGELTHSKPDGSDWPLDAWTNAALFELGEGGNIAKKLRRGDFQLDDRPEEFEGLTVREALAKEFADTVCYVDLAAMQLGISLGDAIADKFNEVSERVGSTVKIEPPSMTFRRPLLFNGDFGVYVPALCVTVDGLIIKRPVGEPVMESDPAEWRQPS